jgi:hypothetical protein
MTSDRIHRLQRYSPQLGIAMYDFAIEHELVDFSTAATEDPKWPGMARLNGLAMLAWNAAKALPACPNPWTDGSPCAGRCPACVKAIVKQIQPTVDPSPAGRMLADSTQAD